MDHESLRIFLSLSQTLHFGRTSKQVHKSASAVSRALQRLEDELGHALFERDNRSVKLTPQGEAFQTYASDVLRSFDQLREALTARGETLRGTVSVFASVTACQSFLPPLLSRFREAYPAVQLKLETGYAVDALEMLQRGAVDVTVAALPNRVPRHLVSRVVAVTPLVFVAPSTPCEVSRKVERRPIEWAEVPLVVPAQGLARDAVDRWFRGRRIKPAIYSEVMGNEALLALVSTGCGVGIVPKLVMEKSPLSSVVRVLDVEPRLGEFHVGICTERRALSTPLVSAFWNAIA